MSGFAIHYGKIEIAPNVLPQSIGPSSAFLPVDHPLPVGCQVELVVGDFRIPATVVRVVELLKGRESDAGMWIRVPEFSDVRRELWTALIHAPDANIPEHTGAQRALTVGELSPYTGDKLEAVLEQIGPYDAGAVRRGEGTVVPIDDGRRTQVMQAVDIQSVLGAELAARSAAAGGADAAPEGEASAHPGSEVEDAAPADAVDPGRTQRMGSADADTADGKKKKRRRRKTKSR